MSFQDGFNFGLGFAIATTLIGLFKVASLVLLLGNKPRKD